ncbi:MAG: NAD(P)/FAD-dependent oxidoreductase [Phototrophicales bacterium]|nr:NAD(P)/FAD-dependent oxidoreductase [Phototrophicales bacterium]
MPNKIIVIGAGVGGLTTAALLQQAGYSVTVLEAQSYAGGCASTFTHKGFRFESGATVVGGFQPNGPHALVGDMLDLTWRVKAHDPAWVTHLPNRSIALTADNTDVLKKFPETKKFWEQQTRIASIAWSLSAQGLPFPPRSVAEVAQLVKVGIKNFPRDLQIIPFAFSTVYDWLRWHGLHKNDEFARFLDAQLLISAQTTTRHVNALYGATALDLARQGVYHIETGIGGVADTLIEKLESLGGSIHYKHRVTKIEMKGGRAVGVWTQKGRKGKEQTFFDADFIIANTTPWDVNELLGENSSRGLKRESTHRKLGWGAFVLHVGVDASAISDGFPDHHQLIADMTSPLGETKSIFMSLSPTWDTSRAPVGQRAMTITTHTNVSQWWELLKTDESAYYAQKEVYTKKILAQIERILPNFQDHLTLTLPGTPVTYQFYTDRHMGMVGGFPQTSLFKARSPRTGIANIRLVGDSIFPGQSTAGVSLGAIRVAQDVQRVMPIRHNQASLIAHEVQS